MKPSPSRLVEYLLNHSGGIIKTEKQLIVVCSVVLIFTLWIMFRFVVSPGGGSADVPAPYDPTNDVLPAGQYDYD